MYKPRVYMNAPRDAHTIQDDESPCPSAKPTSSPLRTLSVYSEGNAAPGKIFAVYENIGGVEQRARDNTFQNCVVRSSVHAIANICMCICIYLYVYIYEIQRVEGVEGEIRDGARLPAKRRVRERTTSPQGLS